MKYTRIFSDENGESHFDDVGVEFHEADYAPPAPPLAVSPLEKATQTAFVAGAPGWGGDEWHPSPIRQYMIGIAGSFEVTASDGKKRTFGAGDVFLLEDTTGKGHSTRIVSDERAIVAVIHLDD